MEDKKFKTCEEYVLNELYNEQEARYEADRLLEESCYEKEALKSELKEYEEIMDYLSNYVYSLQEIVTNSISHEANIQLYLDLEEFSDNPVENLLKEKLLESYERKKEGKK